MPVRIHPGRQPQAGAGPGQVLGAPAAGRPQVLGLLIQPGRPGSLGRAERPGPGLLGQVGVLAGVLFAHRSELAGLSQPLGGERPDHLQQLTPLRWPDSANPVIRLVLAPR
jgi:hypothetical protein